MATLERLHHMDHLRALAMLAGVLFHAALAYSPIMQPFFPTADRHNSALVDALVWLPHLVRMPLFFAVAGFFAAAMIARRGMGGLLRQRLLRVALPFLIAWPLLHLALSEATIWAALHIAQPSPMLLMVREWLAQPDPPQLPPGTGHLWFLYYLLLFSVLHWVTRTLDFGRRAERVLAWPPARTLALAPLLLVPALASVSAPHPAPEGLLPQFWAVAFYGAFFAGGALLQGQPDWLERARPLLPWLFGASVLCYALFLWRLDGAAWQFAGWTLAALEACISVWLTVACLMAGRAWLDRPNPTLRYLSASAYWTYLLHLPVLFLIQYLLLDVDLHWGLKFLAASGLTLVLCLLSYQLLVRATPLRRFVG